MPSPPACALLSLTLSLFAILHLLSFTFHQLVSSPSTFYTFPFDVLSVSIVRPPGRRQKQFDSIKPPRVESTAIHCVRRRIRTTGNTLLSSDFFSPLHSYDFSHKTVTILRKITSEIWKKINKSKNKKKSVKKKVLNSEKTVRFGRKLSEFQEKSQVWEKTLNSVFFSK